MQSILFLLVPAAVLPLLFTSPALALELGLPAQCELGKDCFIQQYPDMDGSAGVADPLCGSQSYDGHKGTDLRILSLKDMAKGYVVIAVADGQVLRVRDGEADHLVETEEDSKKIAGKECGNGLVMQLEDGYEVQYCHLRQGSLVVKPGDRVERGTPLGQIGSSGLAQFPHVHITVTQNGEVVDPLTGRRLSQGCSSTFRQDASLFSPAIVEKLDPTRPEILATGLAGKPVDHQALVRDGPPPQLSSQDTLCVAWSWFSNLRKGNSIRTVLKDREGNILIDNTSEPLERDKATFSAFAGRKRPLPPGDYTVDVSVMQGDAVLKSVVSTILVR